MPVLLIIDMQVGMTWPQADVRNNLDAEARIARLLDAWRRAGEPVVHVRHLSRTPGSPFWPGQPGAEFQPALAPRDDEHVVDKHVTDAFTHSGLERWLHARGLRELVVCGVSTNNSVEATARSAGNLGFCTRVVSDACFTFDQTDLRGVRHAAEEVHQMALANLQGEYASIVDTGAALALLS
ncbi:cysteine hydrolase family protein [Pelomonas cellulosilytica]|uniref:Cysteine hydrolase n=1 Tax=Pelomonas cellulosilytica TaxID=2906762 RepID=A0ABS8XTN2_9BURK|nr:cysteine hydrolase family protein [Pelomonas sp. P8]MCE4554191.1 cysteine hydrolase [Pelomonas sp. P8]